MRKLSKFMRVGAVVFLGGLVLGVGGCTIGSMRAFNRLAESGLESPEGVAEGMSNALVSVAVAIPVAAIGLGLFIVGLIAYSSEKRNREKGRN